MKKMSKGFTLIELMIVFAIIGILAAVAVPSYQDYTKIQACVKKGGTEEACRDRVYGHRVMGDNHIPVTPVQEIVAPDATPAAPTQPQTQCISGYTFVNGKQLLSATNGGVPCL